MTETTLDIAEFIRLVKQHENACMQAKRTDDRRLRASVRELFKFSIGRTPSQEEIAKMCED